VNTSALHYGPHVVCGIGGAGLGIVLAWTLIAHLWVRLVAAIVAGAVLGAAGVSAVVVAESTPQWCNCGRNFDRFKHRGENALLYDQLRQGV
jgi:hypothetical protein